MMQSCTNGAVVGAAVGHVAVLQLWVRTVSFGQGNPPLAAGRATDRVEYCTPVEPHVAVLHNPKSVQLPITQSTGTGAVVGAAVALVGAGVVVVGPVVGPTVAVGVGVVVGCVGGHEGLTHTCVRMFSEAGGHAWPPLAAGVATARVDCCTPCVPHVVTLHCPKSVQLPMTQSCTGAGVGATVGVGVAVVGGGWRVGGGGGHAVVLHA
jgi:hypothetical protein